MPAALGPLVNAGRGTVGSMDRGLSTAIGVMLVIHGLGGRVGRIVQEHRHGPLGPPNAFWFRRGFGSPPQWFAWTEVGVGLLVLLTTATWILLVE